MTSVRPPSTIWFWAAFALAALPVSAEQLPPLVTQAENGKLIYTTDDEGARVPDFSHAGYAGGGVALPNVAVKLVLSPVAGDNTARLQAGLDVLAAQPADAQGFRGAILLKKGRYEISGQLRINASGIVLRGEGAEEGGTELVATGTDRRSLILVRGKSDRTLSARMEVSDSVVAVGSRELHLKEVLGLQLGEQVVVSRPATEAWVQTLGMHISPGRQQFAWKPDVMTIEWERTIVAIKDGMVTLDCPLTTALVGNVQLRQAKTKALAVNEPSMPAKDGALPLDKSLGKTAKDPEATFGRGSIAKFSWPGRLEKIGIENLRCVSTYDSSNPFDEQHAWEAISLDRVRDAWIANVTALHFAGSMINVGHEASRVTAQDCVSLAPVSELGGYRRYTFHTSGQQTLFLRCRSERGCADFTTGYLAAGPNVFLECKAIDPSGTSGSVGSWASGILFDNVSIDGGTLALDNRETWNQGVGWAAANSMLWQCSASVVINRKPPTAQNWADGVWGQFVGDGRWSQVNEFVHPDSLYRAQLQDRLGSKALDALSPRAYPKFEDAAVAVSTDKAVASELQRVANQPKTERPLMLANGWLVANGALLTGTQNEVAWWRGYLLTGREATKPSITRFAPGLIGPEYTDDLNEMTANMLAKGEVAIRQHYGLWYERRRMDHERIRRPDADVWPPFFEQPFARSGQGRAFDGLSKYDLTKYNPWYFGRLREFAELGRSKGLVLLNAMYFQHNIIEAGAHWVDSPWRPTNCLQPTDFTEPPPFGGDTIKMAAEFYDLSNALRRDLHRRLIRHYLEALADQPNVVHLISEEYSGPLHFMQFWIDVVAEWEKETGKHPLIGLSACKDVQDAILADPVRSAVVDVIDFRYWFRTEAGDEFAPNGGTDLAPRQHLRLWKKGRPSATSIASMVVEYRRRFPQKAIIAGLDEADGWAFVAAGGALPKLPRTADARLLEALATMQPAKNSDKGWFQLSGENGSRFAYAPRGGSLKVEPSGANATFIVREIDLKSGTVVSERAIKGSVELSTDHRPAAYWISPAL
ncbi:MAG: DUF6298 domain-containing protein [Nibricoccus sp.]